MVLWVDVSGFAQVFDGVEGVSGEMVDAHAVAMEIDDGFLPQRWMILTLLDTVDLADVYQWCTDIMAACVDECPELDVTGTKRKPTAE